MIPWDLADSRSGIGVRLGNGTANTREILSANTRQDSIKVHCVSITVLLAFERSGKLKKMRLVRAWKCGWRAKLQARVVAGKRQNPQPPQNHPERKKTRLKPKAAAPGTLVPGAPGTTLPQKLVAGASSRILAASQYNP